MSSAYATDSDDDVDVNEPVTVGDLSEQETSDVMDPARRVPWVIKKAEVRVAREDKDDANSAHNVTRLALGVAVGPDGTDGEGANAGRWVFADYVLAFSTEGTYSARATSEWWQKKARGPAKELFVALGYDVKALPKIDREFLDELVGKEFVADLLKKPIQQKTDDISEKTGKNVWVATGEYRNELGNHRAAV